MVCSGLCPRTCTNKVLWFCERSINIDANHLKILPSALFFFFNSASQTEAFRWCNCSLGPQAQSCRCHVDCGTPSSQVIMFESMFASARGEHVLTPAYSQCTESQTAQTQTLCSDPLHKSSPSVPSTDVKRDAYTEPMQHWVKTVWGWGPSSHLLWSREGAQCPTGAAERG